MAFSDESRRVAALFTVEQNKVGTASEVRAVFVQFLASYATWELMSCGEAFWSGDRKSVRSKLLSRCNEHAVKLASFYTDDEIKMMGMGASPSKLTSVLRRLNPTVNPDPD